MDLASLNVLLKYLRNPLRFFGAISMWFFSAAVVVTLVYAFFYTRNAAAHEQTNVLITLLFLMAISGFQFLCYGLIASLIVKTGTRRGVGVSPVIYTSKIMNQEESFLN